MNFELLVSKVTKGRKTRIFFTGEYIESTFDDEENPVIATASMFIGDGVVYDSTVDAFDVAEFLNEKGMGGAEWEVVDRGSVEDQDVIAEQDKRW